MAEATRSVPNSWPPLPFSQRGRQKNSYAIFLCCDSLLLIKMSLWGRIPSLSHLKKSQHLSVLFMVVLSLRCCGRSFSGRGGQRLCFVTTCRSSHCGGFSCCKAQALSMRASVVMAYGLNCPTACRIFPEQGSNPCRLDWQADPNHWTAREVQHTHTHTLKKKIIRLHVVLVAACGIWFGVKPRPPVLWIQSLNHWTTREVPMHTLLTLFTSNFFFNLLELLLKSVVCSISYSSSFLQSPIP